MMDSPPARAPYTIAYEDEHLLVIDKAPGLVVHPARGHREDTLSQLLAPSLAGGEPARAGIVHRPDRDTSGPLVVARSGGARRPPPPPRPRPRRPSRRRALGGGPPPAPAGARAAAYRARVPRPRRGPPARPLGHDRRADRPRPAGPDAHRSEEHTSELQSRQ